jgi:hypothetical protein
VTNSGTKSKKISLVLDVTVVGIDSNYERVTRAGFEYREKHVYPYLESKGFAVRKYQGPLARRYYVAKEVEKPEVDYITGIGHGLYNVYTGDHGDIVFQADQYQPNEVRGKIVHLLSCQTARELGPHFVRNGCVAFFGYDENFTFLMDYKEIFFECDSEIDRAFADGMMAGQVYKRVRALYDRRIGELRAAGKVYVAATLEFDRDRLRSPDSGGSAWGDSRAKLK